MTASEIFRSADVKKIGEGMHTDAGIAGIGFRFLEPGSRVGDGKAGKARFSIDMQEGSVF